MERDWVIELVRGMSRYANIRIADETAIDADDADWIVFKCTLNGWNVNILSALLRESSIPFTYISE
jgi:hypothetical protein